MISIWSVLAFSLAISLTYGLGGYKDVLLAKDDPTVKFMVKGINDMRAGQGDNSVYSLKDDVVKAKSQLVAGMKYQLPVIVFNQNTTLECTAEIWVQEWVPEPNTRQFVQGPSCTTV